MGVRALSSTSVLLPLNGRWVITVETRDDDGLLVNGDPSIVVTLPDASTSTLETEIVSTGVYRATYTPTVSTGRYVARAVATGYGAVDFAAYIIGATTESGMPTADDVAEYVGDSIASWTGEEILDALAAESAAQRSVCRVGAAYPADLRQALLRRVVRNLAMRQLPLAVLQGDAEGGSTVLPGRDPEVRRLEAPHRKLVVG